MSGIELYECPKCGAELEKVPTVEEHRQERVYVASEKSSVYHLRRDRGFTGFTLCGLICDITVQRGDADRGGLRACRRCKQIQRAAPRGDAEP